MNKHTFYTAHLIPAGQLLSAVCELYRAQLGKVAVSRRKIPVFGGKVTVVPKKLLHAVSFEGFEALHAIHRYVQNTENVDLACLAKSVDALSKAWAMGIYDYCRIVAAPNCYPVCISAIENPQILKIRSQDNAKYVQVLEITTELLQLQNQLISEISLQVTAVPLANVAETPKVNRWKTLIHNSGWDIAMTYFGNLRIPSVSWMGSEVGKLNYTVILDEYVTA